MASDFKKEGMSAYVKKIDIPDKGVLSKVYLGPFSDRQAAEEFLNSNKGIGDAYPDRILVKQESL